MKTHVMIALIALAVAASAGEVPFGHPDFVPTPARPVGFRGNWGGSYPGATPPREWSGIYNVIWRQPVGMGEASPIVVGNKVFLLTEGQRVLCLRAATGEILWERATHAPADSEGAKWEQAIRLQRELATATERAKRLNQELGYLKTNAERQKQPVNQAAADALAGLATAQEQKAAAAKEAQEKVLAEPALAPSARLVRTASWAIATPCSDGKFVYVYLPVGAVVCYDLEGNRQWYRWLGTKRVGGGWGIQQVGPSPLLVDGTLVIHYDKIYGLDAATGQVRWETPIKGLPIPSPIPLKVGETWYAMLGTGRALRVADGQWVFQPKWQNDCTVHSPVAYDDLFCWVGCAVRMPAKAGDEAQVVWTLTKEALVTMHRAINGSSDASKVTAPQHMLGWHAYASPVYDNGKIHYQAEYKKYSVFDARTGAMLFSTDVPVGGEVYPALTLAGDVLISSSRRGASAVFPKEHGAGFGVLAINQIGHEFGGNAFVPVGNRLLIHATVESPDRRDEQGYLYCLGDPLTEPPATFQPEPTHGPRPAPTTAAGLVALLDDPDDLAVFATLRALRPMAELAGAVPELAKRAATREGRGAVRALLALRVLGPHARPAVPAMVALLDPGYGKASGNWDRLSRDVLRAIGPAAAEEILAVIQKPRANQGAILPSLELIGGFGPAARAAAPTLATMAGGTGAVADAAKKALGKIQPTETKQP
jgi:outer membrane protein assembly factor BamB